MGPTGGTGTYFCSLRLGASPQTKAPSLGLFGRQVLPFEEPDTFPLLSSDVPSVVLVLLPTFWVQVPYRLALGEGRVASLMVRV